MSKRALLVKQLLLISLVALSIAVLFALLPTRDARAATLCVNPGGTGGCYSSIQAAVDAASPGDTINIAAGTYTEIVVINKNNLTLIGAGANSSRLTLFLYNYGNPTRVSGVTFLATVTALTGSNLILMDSYFDHVSQGSIVLNGGSVTVSNTAIIGCTGIKPWLACIVNYSGTVDLANVTISGSQAGSIDNRAPMTLTNVTINDNGNWDFKVGNSGTMTLTNTIITGGSGIIGNCTSWDGVFVSRGNNLSSDDSCPLNAVTDMTNTNPLLTPLVSVNGTLVHALQPGSPAIDKGDDAACPSADITGFARPYGPHCDIGAYEWRPMNFFFLFFPLIAK